MPYSDQANKPYSYDFFKRLCPTTVLDVGAGAGIYGQWFKDNMPTSYVDAVEVWEPYIEEFGLNGIYNSVLVEDVRTLEDHSFAYDLVIFGDILEHMTKEEAVEVWEKALDNAGACLISIPTVHWPQGHEHGNPYEEHIKDDWSDDEVFETFVGITDYKNFGSTSVFIAWSC